MSVDWTKSKPGGIMNKLTLNDIEFNQPLRTADGKWGLVIQFGDEGEMKVGVQVPGEEDIRWIPIGSIADLGAGALIEIEEPLIRAKKALKDIQEVIHDVETRYYAADSPATPMLTTDEMVKILVYTMEGLR